MARYTVAAQGILHTGNDDLILAVSVRDPQGEAVTGLVKRNFKVWMLGHFFGEMKHFHVVELEAIATLGDLYHLVFKGWAPAVDGTFCFRVRAASGRSNGDALAFVVKVGGGPG